MVRASGTEKATLHVGLARGTVPPELAECPTPCLVQLPEETVYTLTLTAPGCYPAKMSLSFDTLWSWKKGAGAFLDVPMLPRQ